MSAAVKVDPDTSEDQFERLVARCISDYDRKQLAAHDRCLDLIEAAWPGDRWAQVRAVQVLQVRMRLAAKRRERGPLR